MALIRLLLFIYDVIILIAFLAKLIGNDDDNSRTPERSGHAAATT
jgi:hypothetical protein